MKTILQSWLSRALCAALFSVSMLAATDSSALCTASFNAVPDTAGTGISFINTSTGTTGNTSYYWTFGDNTFGQNINEHHIYTSAGWYQVCLYINDSLNGCSSTICDSVFAGNNGFVCQAMFMSQPSGLTVSFLDQSFGNNLNYSWDFGDGFSATGQNSTHTYAQAGQYLVCLTIWNSTCSDTTCSMINVNAGGGGCQASFFTADSAGFIYFINTSTGSLGVPSYVWDFGDGTFGYNQHEMHNYNSNQWFQACLTITFTDTVNQTVLCTSTYCDSVNGLGGTGTCQASFIWQPGTATGEIDFADLSTTSDSLAGWYWDFADGSTSTQQNPSHVFAQSGTYYVCLTITATDQNGTITCTASWCSYIQVQAGGGGCQASFYAYDSLGMYQFVNTSTGINFMTASYFWDFGDGGTSTLVNPNHIYNGTGPYYACLTISDTMTGCNSTFCDSIWVGNGTACQAAFSAVPDTGMGYNFYSTSTGTNSNTSYTWSISDGTSATGIAFHHTFATQGAYVVCLNITVFDSLQNVICTSQVCDTVLVSNGGGNSCNANWGYQNNQFVDFFADLSTGTDSIVSWLWDFGDGTTSTQQNPVHTYAVSGYYYVCLTIETGSGGSITCADTYCQTIYSGNNTAGCQANFSMSPDSSGMGFQFQNISTGTTGATSYTWDFGDGNSSTQENPFHTFTSGWFNVCLTINDTTNNCSSTFCDTLLVGTVPYCNGYFVWSSDTAGGVQFYQFNQNLPGMNYLWTFGDGDSSLTSDPFHQYAALGTYYACLTVTQLDTNGVVLCTSNYCDSVYAGGSSAGCAPQIAAVPDTNGWGNGNVNFNVSSACGNITTITWDFGDGTTGTGMNPSHQYSATGWYIVCVDVEINGIVYTTCDSVFALRLIGIEEAGNISVVEFYPNPAASSVHISYVMTGADRVSLQLIDVTGRLVKITDEGMQASGLHQATLNLEDVSAGMYMLKVTVGKMQAAKRLVVSH